MDREALDELEEVVKPLILWLQANGTPHTTILINQTFVEVLTTECGIPFALNEGGYRVKRGITNGNN